MRPVGAWLEQFRRPVGVPEAAGDELETELMPVFAALDEIEAEAARRRAEAEREASRRIAAATIEVERLLAEGRRQADVVRARAEVERRRAIESEVRAIEAAAEVEAERVRERGLERIPALVERIVVELAEERP